MRNRWGSALSLQHQATVAPVDLLQAPKRIGYRRMMPVAGISADAGVALVIRHGTRREVARRPREPILVVGHGVAWGAGVGSIQGDERVIDGAVN